MADNDNLRREDEKTVLSFNRGISLKVAETDNAHYLVVTEGKARGKTIELGDARLTIGRHPNCDLCLAEPWISKHHCQVFQTQGIVWVEDLNSTNGTFLDGRRINGKTVWSEGVSLTLGNHVLKHEFRSRKEFEASARLTEDLRNASAYVQSLLPTPVADGIVNVDWCLVPSAVLGGDSFGYHWLDRDRFVFHLIDVCGHGVGPAMHSVSILNVLRNQSLPNVDFAVPSQVLHKLNGALPMEHHGDMFFSIWYGVYSKSSRRLDFASGGHPPAILLPPGGGSVQELHTDNPFVGILPDQRYAQASLILAPGSRLCVFSDGAFEFKLPDGTEWCLEAFRNVLECAARAEDFGANSLYRKVATLALDGKLDDDFSLMVLSFP
jgi:serine phosphatase RsbU (regulator of sigma subunit)